MYVNVQCIINVICFSNLQFFLTWIQTKIVTYLDKEKEICLPNEEYISGTGEKV